jgi:formylglycine-generating enzyme required for sulfatase activity
MRSDELDARSDIYSLGVLTYEMLTARTPFQSDTPVGYLRMHMQELPPPFRTVKPDFAALPQLESVVMKALTKDRSQRYGSVLEFAREFALGAAADSQPAAEPEPQRETAKPQPQTKVTPVPKKSVPAAGRDTVAAKAIPELAHPSRRKWPVKGVRWKRVGIIASVVWILGAGVHTYNSEFDRAEEFITSAHVRCDADLLGRTGDAVDTGFKECNKIADDSLALAITNARFDAAVVAFVPIPLGWGFIYLVLFLVRWISRPPPIARTPQVRAISGPPSKVKFVVIAVVALILIITGVWYFLQQAERNPNPDGSIKKADMSSSGKAVESKGKPEFNPNEPHYQVRENPKDGLKYVWIPPGTFMMGCSPGDSDCTAAEKPPHQVTITKGFWMGQTEVTVGAYKRFALGTGREMPNAPSFNSGWANDTMPIVMVNWNDAHDYCTWAGGRLPTEAEWEYAARGGSTEKRYGPIDEVAWYYNNSGAKTHEVGQKRANAFGLYDMLGNVDEWVNDWLDLNYYQNSPSQDPTGPTSGRLHLRRGGNWVVFPDNLRASGRLFGNPVSTFDDLGFRCGGEVFPP